MFNHVSHHVLRNGNSTHPHTVQWGHQKFHLFSVILYHKEIKIGITSSSIQSHNLCFYGYVFSLLSFTSQNFVHHLFFYQSINQSISPSISPSIFPFIYISLKWLLKWSAFWSQDVISSHLLPNTGKEYDLISTNSNGVKSVKCFCNSV